MSLHGVHEDRVETPWILAGLHPAFPLVHMDSMESPCGVPVESTWTCGLHGDSSNSVSWTPYGLYEESLWTPYLIKTHYLINICVKKYVLRVRIELATSRAH